MAGVSESVPLGRLARVAFLADEIVVRPDDPADLPALAQIVTARRIAHYLGLWVELGVRSIGAPAGCLAFRVEGTIPDGLAEALSHFPVAPESLARSA